MNQHPNDEFNFVSYIVTFMIHAAVPLQVHERKILEPQADDRKGIIAGVPFFDEVFKQLDCT
jgi:hypothetical protein